MRLKKSVLPALFLFFNFFILRIRIDSLNMCKRTGLSVLLSQEYSIIRSSSGPSPESTPSYQYMGLQVCAAPNGITNQIMVWFFSCFGPKQESILARFWPKTKYGFSLKSSIGYVYQKKLLFHLNKNLSPTILEQLCQPQRS